MIGLAILAGFGLLSAVVWVCLGAAVKYLAEIYGAGNDVVIFLSDLVQIMDGKAGVRLTDEVVESLQKRAGRKFSDAPVADSASYQEGLRDGETITAQYVLGEMKEETK